MRYYKKFTKTELTQEELGRILGEADPSVYTVLLSHMPVYFEQYAVWGADLCLCGHVHGGLMRLPLIGGVMGTRPNLFPKYSGGQYSFPKGSGESGEKSTMILTCGLGMHTLPIRIFNPGEISCVDLLPDRQQQMEAIWNKTE
jgi:predicted MPP superfamily phosphohydrolase